VKVVSQFCTVSFVFNVPVNMASVFSNWWWHV